MFSFFVLFLLLTSPSVTTPSSDDELSLLLSFNSSLSPLPPDWDPLSHPDHCQWRGVTCDPTTHHVTSLNLTLAPSYPPLTGTIPSTVTQLTSLRHLFLKSNNLSGPIPPNLLKMRALRTLDLSFNHLSGEILISSPCKSLTRLILTANFLVGQIPPQIGQCTNLKVLSLNQNLLEGRIPAEIGALRALRALDVSRNSLTDRIPREIEQCRNLSTVVLTDLNGLEFNAFIGGVPPELMGIPSLEVLWAPRANLDGGLVRYAAATSTTSNNSCRLRVLNLGLNYIVGEFPKWLVGCKNLEFLDLSLNYLEGELPDGLGVGCMGYFNVSQNSLSGSLMGLTERNCARNLTSYSRNLVGSVRKGNVFASVLGEVEENVVLHDFSWNNFSGSLPSLSPTVEGNGSFSYGLLLNDNGFNESISGEFFRLCRDGLTGFAVNLSANQISGGVGLLSSCLQLKSFEAANNKLSGLIPSTIGNLSLLSYLDLRGNNLSGEISDEIGREMTSLKFLDFSNNSLTGEIPPSLADARELEVLLLDHNFLSGEIPQSFSALTKLTAFDVSCNNLSGEIPHFVHPLECEFFRGNRFLHPCPNSNNVSPSGLLITDPQKVKNNKMNSIAVAAVVSASVLVSVLMILVLVLVNGKRKLLPLSSLKKKVVVIFSDAPGELNYESVVKATGNFSIQNLIGSGGFGATYKAELVPGFLVAVKRLSIGRFQGLQQFDAEIRTLGRIRHKNLVTLIGYHMGEVDTFLIYNYLSGGNLEAFIRKMPDSNVGWPVVHKIALDIAQALAYLHYSCVPRIVHRDIKPSNILLDDKLNAYVSDFGLARLLEVSETHATTDVAGTFGYVAPEYATTCRVSNKADVYSYGVVLLELISGKRSLDSSFSKYGNGFTIVAWGRLLMKERRLGEFFCGSFWEDGPKDDLVRMLRLALSCTVESLSVRPSMKQVVERLKQLRN